jgi:ubiquinone/menaquinone biosynthesis C-methylase UbiE
MNNEFFEKQENLDQQLVVIDKIFDTAKILNEKLDKPKIQKYFDDSNWGYRLVHSKEDSVHMALNYDGVFNTDGYYQQVNEISELISDETDCVLELGCGMGFNSDYLAKKYPEVNFRGIDITSKHIKRAKEKAEKLANLQLQYGDFHDIRFGDNCFDVVFEMESVCHTDTPEVVLSEVHRVLKPGGKFMLFDGFRSDDFNSLTDNQKKAGYLVEKTMGVNFGHTISEWISIAEKVGFKVDMNDDISHAILPNLKRFHRIANKYFKRPFIAKMVYWVMSKNLIKNTIAGSLLPFSIAQKMQMYQRIILVKKAE